MSALRESLKSPIFNAGALFDIPTGKFMGTEMLNGTDLFKLWTPTVRRTSPNISIIIRLRDSLEKTIPNTPERWNCAYNLLRYMGYQTKWEDQTKCPEVFWFNTEGNGAEEAQMIEDIFNKDYRDEVKP